VKEEKSRRSQGGEVKEEWRKSEKKREKYE
jgi:hypothetical protein